MKEDESIEGNKLIADFMGWKFIKWCGGEDEEKIPLYQRVENGTIVHPGIFHAPEFNKEWNSLMSVVEKIESIKDPYHGHFGVHICSNSCTIQSTKFRPDKKIPEPPHYFNDFTLDSKITSTWTAIVYFIKWYSAQNPND